MLCIALVISLNSIHLPSATVGMVIEQRSPWPMIAIGLKQKQYGIYSLKYLWVLLLFGIIGLVIEIVGIMRSTDIIIMTGLGIELVVMLWYMFIVYWKVEKAL